MQQGDEYELPIRLCGDSGLIITPENSEDVKIAIKDIGEKTYSGGELRYKENYWFYPLTQSQTLDFGPVVLIQAQVKFDDGSIVSTPTKAVKVGQSIIRSVWGNQ